MFPSWSQTRSLVTATDRWLRDSDGRLAVVQRPNVPIILWLATRALQVFTEHGRPARLLDVVGFGALFTWSWLELFHGRAYVRRVLGLVVLIAIVIARVR